MVRTGRHRRASSSSRYCLCNM